jgi:PAS domain S-box-containing protein
MMRAMSSPRRESNALDVQVLVDSIPALIHTARPDGYLDYFNKRWLEYLGVTLDKVAGWNWTAFVHPKDVEGIVARWRACLATGEIFEYETRVRRANGEYFWMFHRKVPLRDANGSIVKWYGSSLDIDERKTAEEQLRRNSQELRSREAYLAEAQKLSHTGNFGWKPDTGEIVWSDETYRIFEYDTTVKPTLDSAMQRIHSQDRALAQQLIDRASLTGADLEHECRLLMADGRVKHVHAKAHAVQNACGNREFVGAVTDITERKNTEDKIRRLVDADILGIFIWNVDGEIAEANQAFLQMLQYGRQDLVLRRLRWTDLTPAELRERDERALKEALATGVFQPYEKEFLRKDGSRLPVLIGGALFQGAKEGVVFVLDLSEQKRAEQKIREQEMELQQILDFTPQHVAVIGPGEEPIFANQALLNYFGLRLEEWQSEDAQTRFHPDDLEQIQWGPQGGPPDQYEARLRRYDGKYRWFLVYNNPLRDERGQITRWFAAGTDIEDRKQAEDRLRQENVALREEIDKASMFEEIVGTSPALKSVLSRISKVAPSDSTVLITGETGTGKELVARAIHRRSDRASRPFVSVNCAAIPRDLIASELFGHEKGAFTGATQQRLGRFELANGGTIFLDEVGELPAETQIALLRVLQEHEFERVGGSRRIRADVRVIAATNRDLQAALSAGSFRSDLFYRLHVFPIEIPSLRERRTDIPLLVEYFIDRYARKAGKSIKRVNKKTLELLQSYPWPGNIRELQNIIERSVILCETEIFSIDESWLPKQPSLTEPKNQMELSRSLLAQEKEMIEAALKESRGRIFGPKGAAAKLGIPRSTLESKIRSLKINKNRFRTSPET